MERDLRVLSTLEDLFSTSLGREGSFLRSLLDSVGDFGEVGDLGDRLGLGLFGFFSPVRAVLYVMGVLVDLSLITGAPNSGLC